MKLLLDENISYRLLDSLSESYPGSEQVGQLGMGEATDRDIWDYARQHDFAIVTQDADFHELSLLEGGPPLVIWLRCGNKPRSVIMSKLIESREIIEQVYSDPEAWCVEIY